MLSFFSLSLCAMEEPDVYVPPSVSSYDSSGPYDKKNIKDGLITRLCTHFPLYKMARLDSGKYKRVLHSEPSAEKFVVVSYNGDRLVVPQWCSPKLLILNEEVATKYKYFGNIVKYNEKYYVPVVETGQENRHLVELSEDGSARCVSEKFIKSAVSKDGDIFAYLEREPSTLTLCRKKSPSSMQISLEEFSDEKVCAESIFFDTNNCLHEERRGIHFVPLSAEGDAQLFSKISYKTLRAMFTALNVSEKISMQLFIGKIFSEADQNEYSALQELFGFSQYNAIERKRLLRQKTSLLWSSFRGFVGASCSYLAGKVLSYAQLPKLSVALMCGGGAFGTGWAAYKLWCAAKVQRSLWQHQKEKSFFNPKNDK